VKWGEQTKDEMGSVLLSVSPNSPADLKKLRRNYIGHIIQVITDNKAWDKVREDTKGSR
jgi:hypothetical protein